MASSKMSLCSIVDGVVTRIVWTAIGFLICIPLLGARTETTYAPGAVVPAVVSRAITRGAAGATRGHVPPVEAKVTITSTAPVTVSYRPIGVCASPGFGVGYAGRRMFVADVKLVYAWRWGAGVGLGVGGGVFPYWCVMFDPRYSGWSVFIGDGIYEKRCIAGVRVRF